MLIDCGRGGPRAYAPPFPASDETSSIQAAEIARA